jgi:predicted TIM-barrel fold metal-dependent hydrolase
MREIQQMSRNEISRRRVLKGMGLAALFAASEAKVSRANAQIAVPNSVGTDAPRLKAPANACDCHHHHIYDAARFSPTWSGGMFQPNGRVEEYRLLQKRIGTTRNVVVTPAPYIGDNRVTLDAIAKFGANARGVALLRPEVTDAELRTLTDGGIRGLRFSQVAPAATTTFDMIEPLAKRVAAFGWHVQIYMAAERIAAAEELWDRFPTPLVFDHLGHLPQPAGVNHPAFSVIRRLIDKNRAWVKMSGAYIDTKIGPPTYADATKVARAYVAAAPERIVWGSDWPHPNLGFNDKPSDAVLFDLLSEWAPNSAERHKILVENPETLYGFPKSA